MYPYTIIWGLSLYEILLLMAFVSALVIFRIYADKLKLPAKLQNLCLFDGVAAMIFGYFSSVLFQAFYNYLESGVFEIADDTGATFLGGLIGGIAIFLAVYFVAGKFLFKNKEHITNLSKIVQIAVCCIAIAHAVGRIGCLMAGCCYGKETTSFFGINMYYYVTGGYHKVIPVQLYESIFLFILFAVVSYRTLKLKKYNLVIYLISYGVWRFFIEYLRGDDRGNSIISFLTPSQFVSILMIIAGISLIVIQYYINKKAKQKLLKQ
jgi:phosphatidylglycerol:prolipoprotein diacylglycerol transferase